MSDLERLERELARMRRSARRWRAAGVVGLVCLCAGGAMQRTRVLDDVRARKFTAVDAQNRPVASFSHNEGIGGSKFVMFANGRAWIEFTADKIGADLRIGISEGPCITLENSPENGPRFEMKDAAGDVIKRFSPDQL